LTASILCVDDDRNLCQIVSRALQGEGYEVRTAFDGDEALDQIQHEPPDLVLLDVLLPRRDGFDVLTEIRRLPGPAAQLPVVLVTGCTPTPSYRQRADALGALELLTKPVPLERILAVVVSQVGEAKRTAATRAAKGARASRSSRTERDRDGIAGTLDRIPFPAVLHHLHGLRATGVLQLASEKKRKWIQLRDGYPVAVRSNLIGETLGHLLVRTGRITRSVLEASRREMQVQDRRQGEILVAMEVLSEDELTAALREQGDEKLFEVFSWTTGEFRFERGATLQRANALGLGLSPANVILRGVRTRFPIQRVDRYFKLHGDRYVTHGESPFYRFQDVQIEPSEEALLRGLDGTRRLVDVAGHDEGLRRTVYALVAAGLLELHQTPVQDSAAGRSRGRDLGAPRGPRVEERGPQPTDREFAELSELAAQVRARNHFEVLGVDKDTAPAGIRQAYERLSARTHPDRFRGSGRAVRDLAGEVYAMVSEAYATLSDPRRLQEYLLQQQRVRREKDQRETGEKALAAATEFRHGDEALRGRDYESALLHFGRALQLYPEEGDHHAHYGWALYLCHPGDPSIVSEALEHVRRGLKLASHREKPYLFMGRLYKAVGRADVAEKMFTRAVQIEPDCVEALRELRLIHMRREKSKGLFGRLLRR
jgi:CheY-like chemotaxis protein/DnaJ-domain-containing protein 1